MPAGREMDALVAEYVMQWQHIDSWLGSPLAKGWDGFWDGEWVRWITLPESDDEDRAKSWSPSTDIAAAWAVADMLHFSIISQHPIGWLVDTRSNTRLPFVEVYANTAPLAICRAALKVVTR